MRYLKGSVLLGTFLLLNICPIEIFPTSPPQSTVPATFQSISPNMTLEPIHSPSEIVRSTLTADQSCTQPDLTYWQHISASKSFSETQWTASGLMICRIEPDSCAYHHLVGLLDPTIIFKREETPPFDVEDILMHPAMLGPLTRLNQMVQAEWDGTVRLRVTDAYDSLLEHDLNQTNLGHKYSLHFEGRAIDLTTWPVNPSLYGRLCALAHCAGFDWVHHEGTHCHASVKAESLCFMTC